MAAGNTVSSPPAFAAEGSPSEGTIGFPVRDAGPELGAQQDHAHTVNGADAFAGHAFNYVQGVGH